MIVRFAISHARRHFTRRLFSMPALSAKSAINEPSKSTESLPVSKIWTPIAIESLEKAVDKYGTNNWVQVADSVPISMRNKMTACRSKWESMQPWWSPEAARRRSGPIWKESEVQQLLDAVGCRNPLKVDWYQIASRIQESTRSPAECYFHWGYLIHRVNIWHNFELRRLEDAVNRQGGQGCWETIAKQVGYRHSAANCRFKWSMMQFSRRPWSVEEDRRLKQAYQQHGKDFELLAEAVGGERSPVDCRVRLRQIVRNYWKQDELRKLHEAVKSQSTTLGVGNNHNIDWHKVAEQVDNGRGATECRVKWMRAGAHRIYRGKYSREEIQLLNSLVERFGQNWSEIARRMNHRRSDDQLRQYFKKNLIINQ